MNKQTNTKTYSLISTLCLFFACAASHAQSPPSKEAFKLAADYSHSQHGTGLLVMVRGEVLFEDYAEGWNADKPHLLASGTKSFCGVMAACAVHDGMLTLDEKVADTLTEWKEDKRKSQVTIRQLLSLCSGIDGGDNGTVPSYKRAVSMANATAEPGKKFSYGPIPFQCFGELMRRKLEPNGESVEAYLHRRVLDPICIKVGFWRKDFDGNINLPAGAFLTPREWVKFGELVRLGGKWNETEIVPAAVVAECFKQSTAQPAYGMTWWLLGGGDEDSTEASNGRNISPKAKRLTVHRIGELGTPEVHQASYPRLFQKRCMRRYNDCLYERANPKLMQRAHRRLSPRSCCFHPPRNQTERRANEFTSIFESDFWTLTFQ